MSTSHSHAPELKALAETLIEDHYPELKQLAIAFLFRDVADMENGRMIPGTVVRAQERDYTLHGFDWLLTIGRDVFLGADAGEKLAMVDHFLAFIGVRYDSGGEVEVDPKTSRIRTYKLKPDVMEFDDVIQRNGAYSNSLRRFLQAFAERRLKEKEEAKTQKNPAVSAAELSEDDEDGIGNERGNGADAGGGAGLRA